jgi:hypothetical protein
MQRMLSYGMSVVDLEDAIQGDIDGMIPLMGIILNRIIER